MDTSILTLNHVEFMTKLLALEVSKGAKMLLMALKIDDSKVPISTKILAEKLRCSPRSVRRYMKELGEKGIHKVTTAKLASPQPAPQRPESSLEKYAKMTPEQRIAYEMRDYVPLDPMSEAVVEKAVENAIKAGRRVEDGMPKEIEDYIDYISVVEKRPGFFGLSFAVDRQYKKRLDIYYRAYEFVLDLSSFSRNP